MGSPRPGRRVLEPLERRGGVRRRSWKGRKGRASLKGPGDRAPTVGWMHFRVLTPFQQANSVRLMHVCSRESRLLKRAFSLLTWKKRKD